MFNDDQASIPPTYKRSTKAQRGAAAFAAVVISSSLLGGLLGLFVAQSTGASAQSALAIGKHLERVTVAPQPVDPSLPKASDLLSRGSRHAMFEAVSTY